MQRQMESIWFANDAIDEKHKSIEIRQVSAWILYKDLLYIVSKNNVDWGLPGGHPEKNEMIDQSLDREVLEETGMDISNFQREMIGYHQIKITEVDKYQEYLQLRFFVNLDTELETKPTDNDEVKFVKKINLFEATKYIHWIEKSKEYKIVKTKFESLK